MNLHYDFVDFMENACIHHTHWDVKGEYIKQVTVQPNILPKIQLIPWNPYDHTNPLFYPPYDQFTYQHLLPSAISQYKKDWITRMLRCRCP